MNASIYPVPISSRPYAGDEDFWRIHRLALETYPITPVGWNWDIRRWEGQRFWGESQTPDPRWVEWIRLWEMSDGRLVGVAHPEGRLGEAFLQLHPDYRFLEDEMLAWCEGHLAAGDAGERRLRLYALDYDAPRRRLLAHRGWQQEAERGMARRLRLGALPLPVPPVPPGYRLRETVDDPSDDHAIADILTVCFRHGHTGAEFRGFTSHAPSYRRDLDLVMEGPGGVVACYVGLTWDTACRRGIFEPVCTHPDHRGRGLALAAMREGLRRLHALGAEHAFVETGDMEPANALYDAVGFTEAYLGHYWTKPL